MNMTFNKFKAYLVLQLIFFTCLFFFQFFWLFSKTTDADILSFGRASNERGWHSIETMDVTYTIAGKKYNATYTRNETPKSQTSIKIRYSILFPEVSRIESFAGNWDQPLMYYLIYFLFTTMVFTVPGDIFPKNPIFVLSNKSPFVKVLSNNR